MTIAGEDVEARLGRRGDVGEVDLGEERLVAVVGLERAQRLLVGAPRGREVAERLVGAGRA